MIFALLAASAQAWGLEPVFDWTLSATAAPLGAETSFLPGVRQPLWDDPDNLLLSETYLQANGVVMITPAFTRAGIELAFQPAAVFELRARYAVVGYYGTFTAILPFADPEADYGPEAREGRPRTSGWGSFTSVQPTLRLKAGPVVLLASTAWRYGTVTPREYQELGDYWLDPEMAIMSGQTDHTFDSNALLGVQPPTKQGKIYLGAYGSLRNSIGAGDRLARVGPAAVWMLPDGHWTLFAIAQAYLEHRVFSSPLPPYVALRVQYSL